MAFFDFSEEYEEVGKLDAANYDALFLKTPYYRPVIKQHLAAHALSAPATLYLKHLGDVPIAVKASTNNEILDKYNLVADEIEISASFSVYWFKTRLNDTPMIGDVFDYHSLRFQIVKVIEYDFYKNTRKPLHYLAFCSRYKENVYERMLDSETKYLVPAKTADQFDTVMRQLDLVKDPDHPDFKVRN